MVEEMGQDTAMQNAFGRAMKWAAIRFEYEIGTSPAEISKHYGVSRRQIDYYRQRDGWTKPKDRRWDVSGLVESMLAILGRQVAQMEMRMRDKLRQAATLDENDAGVLTNMAKTLEKLLELQAKQKDATVARKPASNIQELRAKLAERLAQLEDR